MDTFMKFIFYFCTKLRMFWALLPLGFLLWLAIFFNPKVDATFKLYPLQITLIAVMVFIVIFYFRVITISNQEIRIHGFFSSKDRAFINKGRTLKITILRGRKIKFELFSIEQKPTFDWMNAAEYIPQEICLFRATSAGGARSAKRALKFFSASAADIQDLFSDKPYENQLTYTTVFSKINEDGLREISIRFDKTVL